MAEQPSTATGGIATETLDQLLAHIPYARFLGIRGKALGDELTFVLPFAEHLIGNIRLPAIHGGATGGFLENAALLQLIWLERVTSDLTDIQVPKTVDFTVEYLRSGRPFDTYARAFVTKRGRRVATVRVEAWQKERSRPIASGHGNFLVGEGLPPTTARDHS